MDENLRESIRGFFVDLLFRLYVFSVVKVVYIVL